MVHSVGVEPTSASLRAKYNPIIPRMQNLGPEDGFEPSRNSYLESTTGVIRPSASPEDSGVMSNILHKNDIYCAVKFPLPLVPHFRFELNLPLYEGRVSTVEVRQIWQGKSELTRQVRFWRPTVFQLAYSPMVAPSRLKLESSVS